MTNTGLVFDEKQYPNLYKYASFMAPPIRPVLGRDREIRRLLASLNRAEVSNAFLLGDAGSGKTMLVQGTSVVDYKRTYVEVDLAKMASSDGNEDGAVQMASRIKELFEETIRYKNNLEIESKKNKDNDSVIDNNSGTELVLFIDEFHLLIQLSLAATQAIKPILAESGTRGIKVIAATTFDEFHQYVEQDQALMQRLQRINIREPSKDVTISILKSIAETHGVANEIYDIQLYDRIYELSNRYIPADSQPRKSILMLDAMIGWFRTYPADFKMDHNLLSDVLEDSSGVKVTFEMDGRKVQSLLNKRIFSQEFATKVIERRLQIAVADLHDKTRPISSFLFTGATGTGKTEMVKGMADLIFGDEKSMIRFDMSEYALETSLDRFREELTSQVWNKSHTIILFDEVEKAHPVITRLMLQVLDDGKLSNAQGREVGFLNTYIVLTTNAGSEVYKDIAHYATSDTGADGLADYQKVIRQSLITNKSFAPEIINRMNSIVPFNPLSNKTYEKIVLTKLDDLKKKVYATHGVKLIIHADIVDYLVYESFDVATDSGGARGLISQLDTEVVSPLARYLNQHPSARYIGVYVEGKMQHRNKEMIKSKAFVKIGTINNKKARR